MGWVKDKGASAPKKYAQGGKVGASPEWDQWGRAGVAGGTRYEEGGKVEEYHEGGSVYERNQAKREKIAKANKEREKIAKEKASVRKSKRSERRAARRAKRAAQKEKNIAASKAKREARSQKQKELSKKPGHRYSGHKS